MPNGIELERLQTTPRTTEREMSSETSAASEDETESALLYGTRPVTPRHTRIWPATYVCVVAASGFLLFGLSKGFNSPVLSDLKSRTGYTSLHRTVDQDLFNFVFLIGSTIITPFSGYLSDHLGRKLSIILCCIPYTIGWLTVVLTVFTDGPAFRPLLYTGRFLVGIADGWLNVCCNAYVVEASPNHYRSALVVLNGLMLTVGLFLGQLVGTYVPYYWLVNIILALTATFALFAVTIKETPRWLLTQGRKLEAASTLRWLNGPGCNVGGEIQKIEESISSLTKLSVSEIFQEFKNKSVYHPVILACFLTFFVEFSGVNAILFNTEDIFKQARVKSPGLTSSFAVGGVQIIAAILGILTTSLVGRKRLLMISYSVASLSHAVMGVYEYLNNEPYCHPPDDPQCKSDLYPLAIVCVAVFIASFAAGIAAASFILLVELVPLRVRGVGIGLAFLVNGILAALIAGLVNTYQILVKPWGVFGTFSLTCFIAIIFVAIFIPETKGKTLEEIERIFDKRKQERYLTSVK